MMHPATYRIRMEGAAPDEGLSELVGMRLVERSARITVLEGMLPDQPALVGTVARLEELGCRVRDLYVVGPAPREAAHHEGP
jgi:hypothetical protein